MNVDFKSSPSIYAILTMLVLGASMIWYQNLIIDFITDNAIGFMIRAKQTKQFVCPPKKNWSSTPIWVSVVPCTYTIEDQITAKLTINPS